VKSLLSYMALGLVLAAPVTSAFANGDGSPVTRESVRAELIQLEKAGYNPTYSSDTDYPATLQAAQAKVAAEKRSGYGPSINGTSATGLPAAQTESTGQ